MAPGMKDEKSQVNDLPRKTPKKLANADLFQGFNSKNIDSNNSNLKKTITIVYYNYRISNNSAA